MYNKSLDTFHKKIVFLLRKISKESPSFQPATVVLPLKESLVNFQTLNLFCALLKHESHFQSTKFKLR